MDLEVTEMGTGEALVVFVHGVLDRGRSFLPVAELLESECRMLLYDRRGYGAPDPAPPGVDGHADDLLAVLDGRRAVVVGHSFGGVTVLAAALRAPELVDALVLYETTAAWAPGWDDGVMQAILRHPDPETAGLRLMLGERYDAMGEDERARRRAQAKAFIAEERSVRSGVPPFDLSAIKAPVVFGQSDPGVMSAIVEYLQGEMPQMEVVAVPGGTHHGHRAVPELFAGLVRRGLELAARR